MKKVQIAGFAVAVLTLVAAVMVVPECRQRLGLEEPHKVSQLTQPSGARLILAPSQNVRIEATAIRRWKDNGKLGVQMSFDLVNAGKSTSSNCVAILSSEALPHEDITYAGPNYKNSSFDKQLNGILPGEQKKISLIYWLDQKITSVEPRAYPLRIQIFSGDGSVKNDLDLEITVLPEMEIKEAG